ncbi:MAG: TolC family protein [Bacteroidia bacterium]|nr:TolC family protein [Bacteroidia bacterium]
MSFTLKQAQEYAYEHNYDLQNARYDVEIARKIVKENTSIGLPQVNATASYRDNLLRPTSIIPNFFDTTGLAPPLEVQFGTRYNATFSAQLTQLIYSGQYLVGLQTARAYLETEKQKNVKAQIDVRDLVSAAYIAYLIVEESLKILDSTYKTVSQMVNETEEFYKNGLIEQLDVEQMELNEATLEANLITTRSQKVIAYNYLKFLMGLEENQEIILTDDLDFFLQRINRDYLMNSSFDYNSNINYRLLKKQEYLVLMQFKLAKTAYQPSILGFVDLSTNAQREVWNFFDSKQRWFTSSAWGLQLNIPIWSSGGRKFAVDQAAINVDKMKVLDKQTRTSLNLQVETVRNDFNTSYLVFLNKKKSLHTASKIYEQTIVKYRQGLASSTDLNQKYNQFLISESEYTQAMFDLLKSNIALSKLLEKV